MIGRGAKLRKQTVKLVRNVKGFLQSVLECRGVIRGNNLIRISIEVRDTSDEESDN